MAKIALKNNRGRQRHFKRKTTSTRERFGQRLSLGSATGHAGKFRVTRLPVKWSAQGKGRSLFDDLADLKMLLRPCGQLRPMSD